MPANTHSHIRTFAHSLILLALLIPSQAWAWGQTGHRAIGEIAWQHMSKKARKNVTRILGPESLAMSTNWMDFIKSDRDYGFMYDWHWVTIPDGKTYEETEKNPNGDVIATIERLMQELETKEFSKGDELFALRCLAHLVGDIHQPLHVGTGLDKGGNDVKVEWFREQSNLHRVWDSDLIDHQQMSYTEWARHLDHPAKEQVQQWQAASVREWAYESMSYRTAVYNIPEDGRLSWRYSFDNLSTVELRLQQAGVRLAGVLNAIYG